MEKRMTDWDCKQFIEKLDESAVDVSDWEASFMESVLDHSWFTDKQKGVIEKMKQKYGGLLK